MEAAQAQGTHVLEQGAYCKAQGGAMDFIMGHAVGQPFGMEGGRV